MRTPQVRLVHAARFARLPDRLTRQASHRVRVAQICRGWQELIVHHGEPALFRALHGDRVLNIEMVE